MAAPWIEAKDRVSDASNTIPCYNVPADIVKLENIDMSDAVPNIFRQHDIPGARYAAVEGIGVAMAGSGAAGTAPNVKNWLKSCGLKETINAGASVVYEAEGDIATNFTASTVEIARGDGLTETLTNGAGTCSLHWVTGQRAMWEFRLYGDYTAPSEATISDALATSANALAVVNATITIGGDSLVIKEFHTSTNTELNHPNYDANDATGVAPPIPVDIKPTFEASIQWTDIGTFDPRALYIAETKQAISAVLGATAGNIMTITGDAYINLIEMTKTNGVYTAKIAGRFSTQTTDTELTYTLT